VSVQTSWSWLGRLRPHWLELLVVVVGVGVSIVAYEVVYARESETARNAFEREAEDLSQAVTLSVREASETVRALQNFFTATGAPDEEAFAIFAFRELQAHEGLESLEWIPRVPAAERDEFEAHAQSEGQTTFSVRVAPRDEAQPLVSGRQEFFPVRFRSSRTDSVVVQPTVDQGIVEAADLGVGLGLDLGSYAAPLEALEQARDTGMLIATAPTPLVEVEGGNWGADLCAGLQQRGGGIGSGGDGGGAS
jgi:hypothetical protein